MVQLYMMPCTDIILQTMHHVMSAHKLQGSRIQAWHAVSCSKLFMRDACFAQILSNLGRATKSSTGQRPWRFNLVGVLTAATTTSVVCMPHRKRK